MTIRKTEPTEEYDEVTTQDLITECHHYRRMTDHYQDQADHIAFIIQQRMEAAGATVLDHPTCDVILAEGHASWDYSKLASLRELLPPDQLAKCYTPQHPETIVVPEKWNMTRAKALGRYGAHVKEVLAAARIPGRRLLRISAKPNAGITPLPW